MKNQESAWLLEEKYGGVETEAFYADCEQLLAGTPLAYLIGQVPFLNCTIYLDSHPLIPRPETEYWVEQAITTIQAQSTRRDLEQNTEGGLASSLKILDLCAGSGAIGVAVAKAVSDAHVTFAEIDPTHLSTITKNIKINLLGDSITEIIESDLFSALQKDVAASVFDEVRSVGEFLKEPYDEYGDEKIGTHNKEIHKQNRGFDYILTNPPYIDAAAYTVEASVIENEPHLALFGGSEGMEIIKRIIEVAPSHLNPDGQLWIEHEPAQVNTLAELALQNGFTIVTHPDQYGVPRFSILSVAQ